MILPLSFKLCKKKVQCDRENTKLKVELKSYRNNCINYCQEPITAPVIINYAMINSRYRRDSQVDSTFDLKKLKYSKIL